MKKGFTLIELLAVIVILAIIALIATPIVLNIINETKESATLRSAEFYLDAVGNSIAAGMLHNIYLDNNKTYNISDTGDICINENCSETLKVELDGEKPNSGSITIENGNIKDVIIDLNDKTIIKNEKGELTYLTSVCILANDSTKSGIEKGTKYLCKVDPNEKLYTFYVLSYSDKDGKITEELSEAATINLILDRNVYYDEATNTRGLVDDDHLGYVAWINQEDYVKVGGKNWDSDSNNDRNHYGPITAMNYLEKATSTWTNLTKMTVSTFDDNAGKSYNLGKTYNVYARLPHKSELSVYDQTTKSNAYLYDYLDLYNNIQVNSIKESYGYWTFSSTDGFSYNAYYVYSHGTVFHDDITYDYGVRPVINIKL